MPSALPPSDHFDGERFRNLDGVLPPSFDKIRRLLRAPRTPWPKRIDVRQQQPPRPGTSRDAGITFIGHSTFLIQTEAINVITDPVFSQCAGPFGRLGPQRVRQPGVRLEDLPPIGLVLLSHNHYDHCDLPTLRYLRRTFDPVFATPLGNSRVLRKTGSAKIVELDWWQSALAANARVMVTPAQHFSARTPWDRNRSLWGGFVFEVAGKRIYFAGDTGYMPRFTSIRERAGALDAAIIPIGAYEPRWFMKPLHMNPAEAVQAHIDLDSPLSIASHFGTFRLTTEGIDEPVIDLQHALSERGIALDRFRVLDAGETLWL